MWDVQVASDVRAYISRFETEAKEVEALSLCCVRGQAMSVHPKRPQVSGWARADLSAEEVSRIKALCGYSEQ